MACSMITFETIVRIVRRCGPVESFLKAENFSKKLLVEGPACVSMRSVLPVDDFGDWATLKEPRQDSKLYPAS